ncbi:TauD/TfdA family dioxygenase [Acidovorax sp. NCPPB 2350]|nr:TauD/TfdA family dioxygenase [Acidovorax sp. NCPPB 2350]
MNDMPMQFRRHAPAGAELPMLILPSRVGEGLRDAAERLRPRIEEALLRVGGVLLRGFAVPAVETFQQFAALFGQPWLKRDSMPVIGMGVCAPVGEPARQGMALRNEQACHREWPMKIWFHCVKAAREGGETPIADSRAVYRRMPERIRRLFDPGVLYMRSYGSTEACWQKAFSTESRSRVGALCRQSGISCDWMDGGGLRTWQWCPAIETHPVTGERVWFNHAHLFHACASPAQAQPGASAGIGQPPCRAYFADGSLMNDEVLAEVRAVLDAETVSFPWQEGDVLMLDNMLTAHGQSAFKGEREVVMAMAQLHGNLERQP